jgi:carbon monoxide dehydrogenase subunit G
MEMTGQYRIAAPRETVWRALNDPEVLRESIPGCQKVEALSPTEMTAVVTAKLGPVKASFTGKVTLSNLNPPESYTITGEGSGGAVGFASGGADVKLTADGAETVLDYAVRANVGGKVAQLGARLIDGTAKKMADDFFARFSTIVAAQAAAAPPAAEAPAPAIEVPTVEAPAVEEPTPAIIMPPPPPPVAAPVTMAPPPPPTPVPPAAQPTPAPVAPPPPPRTDTITAAAPEPPPVRGSGGGIPPAAWIVGLVVVVAILLWIFVA